MKKLNVEELSKEIIDRVGRANSLEEALKIAEETKGMFDNMTKEESLEVMDTLRNHAESLMQDMIKENVTKMAQRFVREMNIELSEEELNEMVNETTCQKAREITKEILKEEIDKMERFAKESGDKKAIFVSEDDDMILLAPQFLPTSCEVLDILSEIREDFTKGIESVEVSGQIVVLVYKDRKDIVLGIDEELCTGEALEKFSKEVFETIGEAMSYEQSVKAFDKKMEEYIKQARKRYRK